VVVVIVVTDWGIQMYKVLEWDFGHGFGVAECGCGEYWLSLNQYALTMNHQI
jgi:hypothetical protein